MTSFGETDLLVKHKRREDREGYLPIAPSNAHPDNEILLRLKNSSLCLRKKSYINTKEKRLITFNSLQTYSGRGKEYVLSKRSYQTLIDYANFVPPLADVHQATLMSTINSSHGAHHTVDPGNRVAVARYIPTTNHPNQMQSTDLTSTSSRTHIQGIETTHPSGTYRGVRVVRFPNILPEWNDQRNSQVDRLLAARPGPSGTSSHNYGTMNYSRSSTSDARKSMSSLRSMLWEMLPSGATCVKTLQILFSLTLTLVVGYCVYRGGCWAIWAVGAAIDWIKTALNASAAAIEQAVATAVDAVKRGIYVPIKAVGKGHGVVVNTTNDAFIAVKEWIRGFLT